MISELRGVIISTEACRKKTTTDLKEVGLERDRARARSREERLMFHNEQCVQACATYLSHRRKIHRATQGKISPCQRVKFYLMLLHATSYGRVWKAKKGLPFS